MMEFSSRMEEELKCPACRRLYTNPVTLSACSHSVCLNCAVRLQTPLHSMATVSSSRLIPPGGSDDGSSIASSSFSYLSPARHMSVDDRGLSGLNIVSPSEAGSDVGYPDSDGMSMVSETDSGVMCGGHRESCLSVTASIGNLTQLSGGSNQVFTICYY